MLDRFVRGGFVCLLFWIVCWCSVCFDAFVVIVLIVLRWCVVLLLSCVVVYVYYVFLMRDVVVGYLARF